MASRSPVKYEEDFSQISSGEYTEPGKKKEEQAQSMSALPKVYEESDFNQTEEPKSGQKPSSGLSFWNRFSAVMENPRAYFALACTPDEQLPQLADLQTHLDEERQELEENVSNLKDLASCMSLLIVSKRQEIFKQLQAWKIKAVKN